MTVPVTVEKPAGIDEKARLYAEKVVRSVEKYIERPQRSATNAVVTLRRVDRAHGNKYEASIRLDVGDRLYEVTDSTLNVFAALDIVRLKLVRQLQKPAGNSLPLPQNRV